MKNRPHLLLALLCLPILQTAAARADGFLLFQHGGRTTGQAGAFVARASDPSAVRFNPAAIARLPGFQFQAGLDFQAPTDEFATSARTDAPEHVIQFPPSIYATWRPDGLIAPLAFGLSIDAPFWSIQNWNPALFPGRFDTLRQELTLFEIRPTVAWAIDERWSLGASVRYVSGDLETSFAALETYRNGLAQFETVEVHSQIGTKIDGLGVDLAAHYDATTWGAGLVASSGVSLDGDGDVSYFLRDEPLLPGTRAQFEQAFVGGGARSEFELPATLHAAFWWTVAEPLTVEVDVAWAGWSSLDRTRLDLDDAPYASEPPALDRRRDWKDTVSIRTGAEWKLAGGWAIGAGLAYEPSPVPDSTVEPGFPRGDAYVAALGGSLDFDGLSFDLGYSYFFYQDRDGVLEGVNGAGAPAAVRGTFGARAQIFSFSARWRR